MNPITEDATVNESNVPIWNGFEEISKERALELHVKENKLVYGIDYEGQESLMQKYEDFNSFEFFAIEK